MGYHRRVTLRCLVEDLASGWGEARQQKAYASMRAAIAKGEPDSSVSLLICDIPTPVLADHPLVAGFRSAFEQDDDSLQRESISGLVEPFWWKQKTSRWRGAATDAAIVGKGEAWLCAGGLRAAGDKKDFYRAFSGSILSSGAEAFLPAAEDRRYQELEEKILRRDAWLAQVQLAALICLHEVVDGRGRRTLHLSGPVPSAQDQAVVHLNFEAVREEFDGASLVELVMVASFPEHARSAVAQAALEAIRGVIEPVADNWRVLPGNDSNEIWAALVSPEILDCAAEAVSSGEMPGQLKDASLVIGVQAHYAAQTQIVDATVEGDAVRGLCGKWFVPTSDPDRLPLCPACGNKHQQLKP